MGTGFWELLRNQTRSLFESGYQSPFGRALAIEHHVRTVQAAVRHAKELVANPDMGLILLHLPIPHAPHTYDPATGQFNVLHPLLAGYKDSLVLLDRTIGELRSSMEQAGLWDKTAVLLSSDHWNRSAPMLEGKLDHRVPYILKLPGQRAPMTYERAFNTILTRELLLAILREELRDGRAVAGWLDRHRTFGDSPYNR
jgi:arylsulfatase A-like enzyme